MGSIIKRQNPSGAVVYRAQIKIRRVGYPAFSESRTFTKKSLASEWIKKREAEIERNPDILLGDKKQQIPSLRDAVVRYLDEHRSAGRSKVMGLRFLSSFEIGRRPLDRLGRVDYAEHVMERRRGVPREGISPIAASTALQELQYVRSVLKHAFYVWGMPVSWQELDFAVEGLAKSGMVAKSARRDRLPTADELQRLTNYFFRQWRDWRRVASVPMHLIIWLAIYTARRQDEICRLMLTDFDRDAMDWLVKDVKHPRGAAGNNKRFVVLPAALPVIDALMAEEVQMRMVRCNGRAGSLVPVMSSTISTAFTRACAVCGIEDLRFHDLRHEAATRLAEDGLTVPQIQSITLHDSWGSLQRYVNARRRSGRLEFEEAIACAANEMV